MLRRRGPGEGLGRAGGRVNAEGRAPSLAAAAPQYDQWSLISRACGKDAHAAGEQPLHHGGRWRDGPAAPPSRCTTPGGGPARSGASAQAQAGPFRPHGLRGPRRTHSRVVPSRRRWRGRSCASMFSTA